MGPPAGPPRRLDDNAVDPPRAQRGRRRDTGRAGVILDNLIAEHKAQPMLIVMPNGDIDNNILNGSTPRGTTISGTGGRSCCRKAGVAEGWVGSGKRNTSMLLPR